MTFEDLIELLFRKHHCSHLSCYKDSHYVGENFLHVALMYFAILTKGKGKQVPCTKKKFKQMLLNKVSLESYGIVKAYYNMNLILCLAH